MARHGKRGEGTMAMPIKETPVLKGKDAARFAETVKRNDEAKRNEKERERVICLYRLVKKTHRVEA
jgi:hypothetical protein